MTEHTSTAPALGLSFQAEIGPGKTLVIQGHIPMDMPEKFLHQTVDMLTRVTDRQQAIHGIEPLEAKLTSTKRQLEVMLEDDARVREDEDKALASSDRRNARLTNQQLEGRNTRAKAIKHYKDEVANLEAALQRAKDAAKLPE